MIAPPPQQKSFIPWRVFNGTSPGSLNFLPSIVTISVEEDKGCGRHIEFFFCFTLSFHSVSPQETHLETQSLVPIFISVPPLFDRHLVQTF